MSAHTTTRGDHTLNLRVLRFRRAPDREEPVMLALDLCARHRFDDAIDVAEAALDRYPDDAELLLPLGRAYYEEGQHERAQAVLVAAAKADPTWAEPYVWLSKVLDARGRPDKATELAVRAVELGATDADLRARATAVSRNRALEARLARWRDDELCEDGTLLALSLLDAGRDDDAREVIGAALAEDPADEDVRALAVRAGVEVPVLATWPQDVPVEVDAPQAVVTAPEPSVIIDATIAEPAAPAPAPAVAFQAAPELVAAAIAEAPARTDDTLVDLPAPHRKVAPTHFGPGALGQRAQSARRDLIQELLASRLGRPRRAPRPDETIGFRVDRRGR